MVVLDVARRNNTLWNPDGEIGHSYSRSAQEEFVPIAKQLTELLSPFIERFNQALSDDTAAVADDRRLYTHFMKHLPPAFLEAINGEMKKCGAEPDSSKKNLALAYLSNSMSSLMGNFGVTGYLGLNAHLNQHMDDLLNGILMKVDSEQIKQFILHMPAPIDVEVSLILHPCNILKAGLSLLARGEPINYEAMKSALLGNPS